MAGRNVSIDLSKYIRHLVPAYPEKMHASKLAMVYFGFGVNQLTDRPYFNTLLYNYSTKKGYPCAEMYLFDNQAQQDNATIYQFSFFFFLKTGKNEKSIF